jgi:antitoxin component YwqK of YwqJK toxin-antitoxin module
MKTIKSTTKECSVMGRLPFLLAAQSLFLCLALGCEQEEPESPKRVEEPEGLPLSTLIHNEEFWEGSAIEFGEKFVMKDDLFYEAEGNYTYSGVIKIRAVNGSLAALKSYSRGVPHGDFFKWHENGKLQSKSQFKNGMRHGYFYIWTKGGIVYSRNYFQEDLEDFGRFPDEGASESGKSLAAIELEKWEGTGAEFYHKFAGDPGRGGTLYIRETEELYNGTITALDDKGRKEARLRYSNGKYQGTISKWNVAEVLWEEAEFDRGEMVEFTIKNGKPFDAALIIDLSKDPSMVDLLFKQ